MSCIVIFFKQSATKKKLKKQKYTKKLHIALQNNNFKYIITVAII